MEHSINPSFYEDSQYQFAWDSVSLGLLKECPRKYFYTLVQGYHPKTESIHLRFGILIHSALEHYDIYRVNGASHDEATDRVVEEALRDSFGMEGSNDNKKTRQTLIRTIVWYLEHYKDDDVKTVILANGKPAVELSFKLQIEGDLMYCGHLDRVVEFQGDKFVMDRKTTGATLGAYYFTQYNPDNQMSGYSLASAVGFSTPVKGVIIDAMQIAVGFTSFGRTITTRTEKQLEEWVDDFKVWTSLAFMFADKGSWPMNDKSCHKYGGCPFREVCSHDPSVRENFLKTRFEVRHWNPLEER